MSDQKADSASSEQRPWASPRQEPTKGIVQPRVIPPFGKPTRHTNKLDYVLTHVMKEAMRHKHAWPFMKPVDSLVLNIPNYHNLIQRPMDLKTVESRIRNIYYTDAEECIRDIDTVFGNCYQFNGRDDDITIMAQNVQTVIRNRLEQMPIEEEAEVEASWIKKKKPKGGEISRLVAGSEDRRRKESTPRMSEPPSECGSEASVDKSAGRMGSKTMKTIKRKAENSDDDEKPDPIRPAKREGAVKKAHAPVTLSGRIRFCQKLLTEFFSKKHSEIAWPFYEPVNAQALGLLDYHKIIKYPMDMATIKKKLEGGEYADPEGFEADIKLMLNNCFLYNPANDPVHKLGQRYLEIFERKWRDMPTEKGSVPQAASSTPSASAHVPPPLPSSQSSSSTSASAAKQPKISHVAPMPAVKQEVNEGSMAKTEDGMRLENALAMIRERETKLKAELQQVADLKDKVLAAKRSKSDDGTLVAEQLLTQVRTICQPAPSNMFAASSPNSNSSPGRATGAKPETNGKVKNTTKYGYEFDSDSEESNVEMTYDDKRALSLLINRLPSENLSTIVSIIERREQLPRNQGDRESSEIEIDFEALGTKALREMDAFARKILNLPPQKPVKKEVEDTSYQAAAKAGPASANLNNATPVVTNNSSAKKKSSESEPDGAKRRKGVAGTSHTTKRHPNGTIADGNDDNSDSNSSSSSSDDDDSDDDYRAQAQNRKGGMPPSSQWSANPPNRVGGMGGQPPMARVPPPLPTHNNLPTKPSSQQQSSTNNQTKSTSKSSDRPNSNAGLTILDTLLPSDSPSNVPQGSFDQHSNEEISNANEKDTIGSLTEDQCNRHISTNETETKASEKTGESEEDRIARRRMEARRAREAEEDMQMTSQMEMMSAFEYENMC